MNTDFYNYDDGIRFMADNYLHSDITALIIKAFYNVYNQLGYGFPDKVYENALVIKLKNLI